MHLTRHWVLSIDFGPIFDRSLCPDKKLLTWHWAVLTGNVLCPAVIVSPVTGPEGGRIRKSPLYTYVVQIYPWNQATSLIRRLDLMKCWVFLQAIYISLAVNSKALFPVEEVLKMGHVPPRQGVYVERKELIEKIRTALSNLRDQKEGWVWQMF